MSVVKLNRAIQYRAYPTEEQAVLLGKTFGCVRFVWNHSPKNSDKSHKKLLQGDKNYE